MRRAAAGRRHFGYVRAVLPLLLSLTLFQAAPARTSRDVATIPAPGGAIATRDLSAIPDADLARRIGELRAEQKRGFSDRRALLLEKLLEEQERRRHEREWDAAEQARRAAAEAESAREEARFQAEEASRREALAAEQRLVATARAQAARDEELAAEELAIELRQTRTRWLALGALAAVVVGGAAWALWRWGRSS